MSFFNDFLLDLGIDDIDRELYCSLVFNRAAKLVGNIKIEQMSSNEIVLKCKKELIRVHGQDLVVKSLSKGEIDITGKIFGVTKL